MRTHTHTTHTHSLTHSHNTHTHTRSKTHSLTHRERERPERSHRVKVMHSKPTQAAAVEDGKCEKGHAYDADVPSLSNSHPAGMGVLRQSHEMTGGVQHLVYVEHSQYQTHDDTNALQAGGIKIRLDTHLDTHSQKVSALVHLLYTATTCMEYFLRMCLCLAKLWQPCSEKHSLL